MNKEEIREKLLKMFPGESELLNALWEEDNIIYIYHFVDGRVQIGKARRLLPNTDKSIIEKIEKREKEKIELRDELEKQLMANQGTLVINA